jgi:hypothetical protein
VQVLLLLPPGRRPPQRPSLLWAWLLLQAPAMPWQAPRRPQLQACLYCQPLTVQALLLLAAASAVAAPANAAPGAAAPPAPQLLLLRLLLDDWCGGINPQQAVSSCIQVAITCLQGLPCRMQRHLQGLDQLLHIQISLLLLLGPASRD